MENNLKNIIDNAIEFDLDFIDCNFDFIEFWDQRANCKFKTPRLINQIEFIKRLLIREGSYMYRRGKADSQMEIKKALGLND